MATLVARSLDGWRRLARLVLLLGVVALVGCGGGSGSSLATGSGGGTAPDLSAQTASARLDFNQAVARARQETRSSILPAGTDTLSVVGLDVGGSKVFGPQEYPRPADDVLVLSVPVTVTRLLVTARAGQVELTTFAAEPKLKLGVTVTVPFSEFRVVGVVIKSMQTSKMPALIGATDMTATVSAESPKGLSLTYAWETTGGFVVTSAQPYGASVAMTAPGTYSATGTVKVTVRDSEGATAVGTLALSTVAKDAPVISSITVSPQPVMTVADIVATVLDPLGGPLSYSWTLGGLPLAGSSDRMQWTSPGIPGTYEVALRATGVTGLFTDSSKAFTIGSMSPWPRYGRDLQGTRVSPVDTSQNAGQVAWTYNVGGLITYCSPAIAADGTIYVGSSAGQFCAIGSNGVLKWAYNTGDMDSSPTLAADGTIYVAGRLSRTLYALRSDGSLKWSYLTGGNIVSSPAIAADGTVYFGSLDKNIYALRPDGSLKWSYQTGDYVEASPVIAPDGTVYIGSWDGNLHALRPDGSLKWAYQAGGAFWYNSPAVGSDGTVYAGAGNSKFFALRSDGSLKWIYPLGGVCTSSPAIGADGTCYVQAGDFKLHAVRPDGTSRWTYTMGVEYSTSSPAIGADGTIYVGSRDTNVYALRPDGTCKWSCPTAGQVYSSPAIGADGTVYIGCRDGRLYAIR